ncbi:hypothetical protein SLS56_010218 [Neofusicoccum ribis]|uniref:Uncharacterized protein n=1 Tax=Neofusicoccum ribis TaxID=45134 RepID=A0ABR3SF58_9PEZI
MSDFYAKRPVCNSNYYEIFNQDNVDLIDLKDTPITKIIAKGIRTSNGKVYELDVIMLTIEFDAIDGNYTRLRITGREETIKDHWANGTTSYLGLALAGFPNFFIISGP